MSHFRPAEYQRLCQALQDAFNRRELEQLLLFGIGGRRLDVLVADGPFTSVTFDLVGLAQREGWVLQLIRAAHAVRPRHVGLAELAERHHLTPEVVAEQPTLRGSSLEAIVRAANPMMDPAVWRERLSVAERRVCRIEVAAQAGMRFGTGFLVGPDLLLTNYHVVESVIPRYQGAPPPGRVVARFDYLTLPEGLVLNPGKTFGMAAEWLVDSSPYSSRDREDSPSFPPDIPLDELDYALLRADGMPGMDVEGRTPDAPAGPERGWFTFSSADSMLVEGSPLCILQHPQAQPLKLVIDTEAVLGFNANRTRVRYRANTLPGSSGAPCFDGEWNLVALHHAGDRNWQAAYNQGIPASAITRLWDERGTWERAGIERPT